jgi:hypothetical protein
VVAHLMFDLAPLAIGTTGRSGPSQWLAEAVATFTLVLAILGVFGTLLQRSHGLSVLRSRLPIGLRCKPSGMELSDRIFVHNFLGQTAQEHMSVHLPRLRP